MGSTGNQVKEKHSWYCVTTDLSRRKVLYPFLRIHFLHGSMTAQYFNDQSENDSWQSL